MRDDDYAYDRTNQPAPGGFGWTIQIDTKHYPLMQWAIYHGHVRVEGGFADRDSAKRELLLRLRSTR